MANNGSINSQANFGSFVPSTFIWQMQEAQSLQIDPGLKQLLVKLYQNLNLMQISLNQREFANYSLTEVLNGQTYFPVPGLNSLSSIQPEDRQVFRTTINFGPLPNTTTITVPHDIDIDSGYSFTRIYGAATNSNQTSFIPLPYASCTDVAHNVELKVTDTNVFITSGADYSDYINTYIVLEYIKSL